MAHVNIKRQDLKLQKQIGLGGFSTVFQATWNGKEVAVKKLTTIDRHEVKVLSGLDHPNIVKLLGVVDEDFDLCLVLELCNGGSLRSYLDQRRLEGERLSEEQFLEWAKQAARPLQYLKQMKVVHKDVKSLNYLIADGSVLKLADFGVAKKIDSTRSNATGRVTHAWMAPELLRDFKLSPKYDTYSYGIVVWELWSMEIPFEGADPVNIIWRVCKNNERPIIPADCPKPIADLLRQCWHTDWQKRPTFDHILSVLESPAMELKQESGINMNVKSFIAGPWELEKEFGQHGSGKLADAMGIAVNPNGNIAVADCKAACVKVYSSEGEYKLNLETTQGLNPGSRSCPTSVTVNSEGNYYVTDETQYVKVFDVEGGYKGKWAAVSPDNKPSDTEVTKLIGLAMDAKGQLLVGEIKHRYISKHRQDGSHITSIKVGIGPWYLAVTSQDAIIISDWLSGVQIVDSTGQLLQTLKPTPDVTHWLPGGVCCYEDIINICNPCMLSHGIYCFSASGDYLGSIAVRGVPCHITFVKGSNKFVLACVDRVQVYSCKK